MRVLRTAWLPVAVAALSCASLGSPKVPETPDGTVRFLAAGLAESRPQVLWQGLPSSWQADLTACLRESAEKSDPEVYAAGWRLAGKAARILEEKRTLILDHPMVASQVKEREKVEAVLAAAAGLLRTLVESELSDREALRKIDLEKFLAGTGAKLMGQAQGVATLLQGMDARLPGAPGVALGPEQLRLQEVAVVSQSADAARLRIVLVGGRSGEHDWVRVEGKWVPKEMAEAWPKAMASARQQLAAAVPTEPERKQALLVQLRMVEGALDGVLATETAAEFQAAAGAAFGTIMGAAMAQAPTPAPKVAVPTPSPDAAPGPAADPTEQYLRRQRIAVRDARRHVGQLVFVIAKDGIEFEGTLLGADGRTLTLERESEAGTMTHAMAVSDVKSLEVWR